MMTHRTMIAVVTADDTGATLLASVRVPSAHVDDHMHDLLVQHDPRFLDWLDVDTARQGGAVVECSAFGGVQ